MPEISLTRPPGWSALGERWRALESRAACSFFQSWTWVGCLAEARYRDPWLLAVEEGGETVALGLFNRHARVPGGARLWLNESGRPAMDRIHVEHNGLVVAQGAAPDVRARALSALAAQGHRVVLSGVDAAHLAAADATGALVRARANPAGAHWVDLAAVRAAEGGHLALLSGNTRQQIRRSLRRYAEAGALRVERAGSLEEARVMLEALGALHQRSWQERGQPGAFANPDFVAFHEALLARGWPRGEIDVLRVAAGGQPIGFLYNFRWRDRVANYQSGFDYAGAERTAHRKPGLTCHHLAVAQYAAEGFASYDLLAGNDRYKTSLATGAVELHWIEMLPAASLSGLLHRARRALGRG